MLLDLPQLGPVRRAEQGISRRLLAIDRPFGAWAPGSRLFKLLAGPTITDVEGARARVGLVRLEAARELVGATLARARGLGRTLTSRTPAP